MQTKRRLIILLLISGSISCSQEKEQVVDNFQVAKPQMKVTSTQLNMAMDKLNKSEQSYNFENEFLLDLTGVSAYQVHSTCYVNNKIFHRIRKFTDKTSLPLSELVNFDALTAGFGHQLECQFKFVAQNSRGSTHSFFLQKKKIEKPNDFAIKLQESNKLLSSGAAISIAHLKNVLIRGYGLPFNQAHLLCDEFQIKVDYDRWPLIMNLLPIWEINTKNLKLKSQACQIYIKNKTDSLAAVSPPFRLRFNVPTASFRQLQHKNFLSTKNGKHNFLSLYVTNNSKEAMYFVLPNLSPRLGFTRLFLKKDGEAYSRFQFYIDSPLSISGKIAKKIINKKIHITLPAEQRMEIHYAAKFQHRCNNIAGFIEPVTYYLDLSNIPKLHQVAGFEGDDLDYRIATSAIMPNKEIWLTQSTNFQRPKNMNQLPVRASCRKL